jgi:hypothetical protein
MNVSENGDKEQAGTPLNSLNMMYVSFEVMLPSAFSFIVDGSLSYI